MTREVWPGIVLPGCFTTVPQTVCWLPLVPSCSGFHSLSTERPPFLFLFWGTVGSFECPGVSKLARGPHTGLGLFLCCLWTQNSFYMFLKREIISQATSLQACLQRPLGSQTHLPNPTINGFEFVLPLQCIGMRRGFQITAWKRKVPGKEE